MCRPAAYQVLPHTSITSPLHPLMLRTDKAAPMDLHLTSTCAQSGTALQSKDDSLLAIPRKMPNKRSVSCFGSWTPKHQYFAVSSNGINFQNEAFRLHTQAKVQQLIAEAEDRSASSSTNAFLAKKALKYRKVAERVRTEAREAPVLSC